MSNTNTQTNTIADKVNQIANAVKNSNNAKAKKLWTKLAMSDLGTEVLKMEKASEVDMSNTYFWGTSQKAIDIAITVLESSHLLNLNSTGSGMQTQSGYNTMNKQVQELSETLNILAGHDNTTSFILIDAGMGGGSANGGLQRLLEFLGELNKQWVSDCSLLTDKYEQMKALELFTIPIVIATLPHDKELGFHNKYLTAKSTLEEIEGDANYMIINIQDVAEREESFGTNKPFSDPTLGPILGMEFAKIHLAFDRLLNCRSKNKNLDISDLRTVFTKYGECTIATGEGVTLSKAFNNANASITRNNSSLSVRGATGSLLLLEINDDELSEEEDKMFNQQIANINNKISTKAHAKQAIIENAGVAKGYRVTLVFTGIPSGTFTNNLTSENVETISRSVNIDNESKVNMKSMVESSKGFKPLMHRGEVITSNAIGGKLNACKKRVLDGTSDFEDRQFIQDYNTNLELKSQ